MAARDGAAAGGMSVVPVLHVVLLGQPGRTRVAYVVVAQEILDRGWCRGVDQVPPPHLGLVRAARMPDRDRPRLPRMQRGIWKNLAGAADHPAPFGAPTTALGLAIAE